MTRFHSVTRFALLFAFSLTATVTVFAAGPKKTSPDLAHPTTSVVSVIVQYNTAPTPTLLQRLTSLAGPIVPVLLKSINAVQVSLPVSSLSSIAADSNVKYISLDRAVRSHGSGPGSGNVPSISTSPEYTVEPINAPAVWSMGYKGGGIGVAVIDSGISGTADLSALVLLNRVIYSQSFVPSQLLNVSDQFGHGTHVAGLIGGNGAKSTGSHYFHTFLGIAPNVNLINLRVLDGNGQGSDTAVIQAIETAISLKNLLNIRVINLSLGRPVFESYALDPLCQAVEQAWKAGIVVVVAAGNDGRDLAMNTEGYGTIEAPGNDPYVITVGAVRTMGTPGISDDAMASYSSKGPSFIDQVVKPDLVAPGNLVTSLLADKAALQLENPTFYTPLGFYQSNGNPANASQDYMPLSGTSMSTAVASGAVALLLNSNGSLTPDAVKALLMRNANKSVLPQTSTVLASGVKYIAHNDIFTVGAGYLDIAAAVRDAKTTKVPAGTAKSPIAVFNPETGATHLVVDQTVLWGAGTTSGSTVLWGADNVYGQNAFTSGSTVLWGAGTTSGSTVLWGAGTPASSTVLWGANGPGANTVLWGADNTNGSTVLWGANDPSAFTSLWSNTVLWGAGTPDAATVLWGASDLNGSTVLWGAGDPSSSTVLWGATTLNGSTVLWGASVFAAQ
jgi:serine protease AprX